MSRHKPEYDHWLNKYSTDPAYRAVFWDRVWWAWIGFMAGLGVAALAVGGSPV